MLNDIDRKNAETQATKAVKKMGYNENQTLFPVYVMKVQKLIEKAIERALNIRGDLGIANGWRKTPKIVEECQKKGHHLRDYTIGSCYHLRKCSVCKYWYEADSSD